MSLSANITPAGKALVGNPIKLSVLTEGLATYEVSISGETIYTGSGMGGFYVFLNDIIRPYLSPQLCSNDDSRMVIPITGQSKLVTVKVTDDDGNGPITKTLTVYLGGIGKDSYRQLGNTSIFTSRFLAQSNFFFTSRGSLQEIVCNESEISPLPLILPSNMAVKSGTNSLAISTVNDPAEGQFCALNVYKARNSLTENDSKPDSLDIYVGQVKACTLRFEHSRLTKDSYLVRFLDSLGCYTLVEFTGTACQGVDSMNDSTYSVYDPVTDSYSESRNRVATRPVISMSTGYKTKEELLFLEELLRSEDVTLLSYRGKDVKVTATCSSFEVAVDSFAPGSLVFEFRSVDEDESCD